MKMNRQTNLGIHSVTMTVLVLCILGVLNFLVSQYPKKLDLTRQKIHTLSDQTTKVVSELNQPIQLTYFARPEEREKNRPLLENIRGLSRQITLEYVDPAKEPVRTQEAGIKQSGTLQLATSTRNLKIEGLDEEKFTNTLIKLLKTKTLEWCILTQHGERDLNSTQSEGYQTVKTALQQQNYTVKDINLITEGKIPSTCSALAVLGPKKSLFPQEIKLIQDYLSQNGKALFAFDSVITSQQSQDTAQEWKTIFDSYGVTIGTGLIIDPVSKALQLEPTMPIVASYSKDSPITKDFKGNTIFPLSRPLIVSKTLPPDVKVESLAMTTPNSWAEKDTSSLKKGAVKLDPEDQKGPLTVAVSITTKKNRLVVLGSSHLATNQFSKFGNNLDFFMNSVSWIVDDESLISIRSKEDIGGKIELTQNAGTWIFLVVVIFLPLIIAITGIIIWIRRKKL